MDCKVGGMSIGKKSGPLSIMVSLIIVGHLIVQGTRADAGEISFGGVIPGAGTIRKRVVSMREAKFLNLIEQHTDFSCGAAALATILKYAYERSDITERDVLQGLFSVSDRVEVMRRGFSLLDIKNYLATVEMRGRGYKIPSENLEKIKVPCIALLNIKGYRHFVVFKKVLDGRVYLGDPALGNRIMAKENFLAGWNGVLFAVIGRGFDTSSALLTPAQPLTARNLKEVYASVSEVDLLDFGFMHKELF